MKGTVVNEVFEKYNGSQDHLIQMMLDLQGQSENHYLHKEWLEALSGKLGIPLSKLYDVATFYAMFNLEPKGRYVVELCKSAPCYVNNAKGTAAILEKVLGIRMGETTPDKLFTLQYTSCFGACDVSPAMKIEDTVYGNLTEGKIVDIINKYRGEQQ